MTNEETIQIIKSYLPKDEPMNAKDREAFFMAIEALKTLDEIIEYMNDETVTWRDISDDIINSILSEHNWKK